MHNPATIRIENMIRIKRVVSSMTGPTLFIVSNIISSSVFLFININMKENFGVNYEIAKITNSYAENQNHKKRAMDLTMALLY